jgi:hypothetical protein
VVRKIPVGFSRRRRRRNICTCYTCYVHDPPGVLKIPPGFSVGSRVLKIPLGFSGGREVLKIRPGFSVGRGG